MDLGVKHLGVKQPVRKVKDGVFDGHKGREVNEELFPRRDVVQAVSEADHTVLEHRVQDQTGQQWVDKQVRDGQIPQSLFDKLWGRPLSGLDPVLLDGVPWLAVDIEEQGVDGNKDERIVVQRCQSSKSPLLAELGKQVSDEPRVEGDSRLRECFLGKNGHGWFAFASQLALEWCLVPFDVTSSFLRPS